jgi:hypothetical protein
MFAEIKMDMAERGNASQQTDVLTVEAVVLEVVDDATRQVASVRFSGTLREDNKPQAETFDEVWHLIKPHNGSSGWLLAGIQQTIPTLNHGSGKRKRPDSARVAFLLPGQPAPTTAKIWS